MFLPSFPMRRIIISIIIIHQQKGVVLCLRDALRHV